MISDKDTSDQTGDALHQILSMLNKDKGFEKQQDDRDSTKVSRKQQLETQYFLGKWASEYNISMDALNSLLQHLYSILPLIPKLEVRSKKNNGGYDSTLSKFVNVNIYDEKIDGIIKIEPPSPSGL